MEQDLFAVRLRTLRQRRKLSRVRLGELCGLDKNAVGRYEAGKARPKLDALMALADYFGVTLDQLVGRDRL